MKQKLTITLFLVTIFGFSIAMAIVPDRTFSDMENRVLSSFPEFSFKRLVNGEYAQELESYLTDQIVFKDALVVAKNQWDRIIGKKCFGDVYYVDGRYLQAHSYHDEQLRQNIGYIGKWCEDAQVREKYFLLAPTAVQVYDVLPYGAVSEDGIKTYEAVKSQLADFTGVTYPVETMKSHDGEAIYYNTDHHWTMQGAYYGYTQLAEVMGLDAVGIERFRRIDLEEGFFGSLYSQAPLLGVEADEVVFYDYSSLAYTVSIDMTDITRDSFLFEENFSVKDKYTSLFNGNYGKITVTNHSNEAKDKGTLLVFKDSYANSLVPYLIHNYREIVMIDMRFYSDSCKELYEDTKADTVLFIYNTDFINTDSNFWKLAY